MNFAHTLSCISFLLDFFFLVPVWAFQGYKETNTILQQQCTALFSSPSRCNHCFIWKEINIASAFFFFQFPNVYQADENHNSCNSKVPLFIVDISCVTLSLSLLLWRLVYFFPSGTGVWQGEVLLGLRSLQCPLMWTDIINDIAQSDARWRPGLVCVCVAEREKYRHGEGGEDEKTRGASFDAVNVQIYVEGQWSTFIRSSFLPPSHPAPASSHPISSYPTPTSPTGFLFSPLPLILSHSVTHHHSSLLSPVFPSCPSSVSPDFLSSLPPSFRLPWKDWNCCGLQHSDQ